MSGRAYSLFLGSLVDELLRLGVSDVVISPGSRSTPLAMVFHESGFSLVVDVDERGAGFFALGLARAKQAPVCLVCTSGTAVANYFPAICEAAAARVPLIVLTADRPHELRALGANQTTDQIKIFGDMIRFFHEMPLPSESPAAVAFARQLAREAVVRSTGAPAGAVHLNFPFAEPLLPDLDAPDMFTAGRRETMPRVAGARYMLPEDVERDLNSLLAGKRGVIVCGEGVYPASTLDLARRLGFPLLADPLSNLRRFDDEMVIDNYDNIFRRRDVPEIDLVIRFGQYPISKSLYTALGRLAPTTIAVDEAQSRDFNHIADVFVRADITSFVESSGGLRSDLSPGYAQEWSRLNAGERVRILRAATDSPACEGAYVMRLIEQLPEHSLLFAANSMAIRYVDTFYLKRAKDLHVMCNRGLAGIDGTISSALGAARCFASTALVTGDLAFLHDINAMHLRDQVEDDVTIVVVNNNGGGIFEFLPQKSEAPYFERLFLTRHGVDFASVVAGFGIPYFAAEDLETFDAAYARCRRTRGIKVIEVRSETSTLAERYREYC